MYLEINEDDTITFYAANGQKLMCFGSAWDMTLAHDRSKWLLIKLEYHYDMNEPQFDIVVKYADLNTNSYSKVVASTLVDVSVAEAGADPSDFSAMDINLDSDDGKIYVDDLYIRNVFVP